MSSIWEAGAPLRLASEHEYSVSLELHANLEKVLQSFKVDGSKHRCEMLERVFFQEQSTCLESGLIDRIYDNNNIRSGNRSNMMHLLHLLVEPLDQDAAGMEWTLAKFCRQQHSAILLQFQKFFQKTRDFFCLVIGRRANFWLDPPWNETVFVGRPTLFLKVMVCKGSAELFDFLVQHDVTCGTRWTYSTHCEFFQYLHANYAYIQDHGLEGMSRRQSRLRERIFKLDSIVKHNRTSILTFEYVWEPLTHT